MPRSFDSLRSLRMTTLVIAPLHFDVLPPLHNLCLTVNRMAVGLYFTKIFISPQKSGLSPTMYVILPIAAEKSAVFPPALHLSLFVTGLYLDKRKGLWQYIVEVFLLWHNILCLVKEFV